MDLATAFARDGFVSGVRVLNEPEVLATRAAFDSLEAREGRQKCQIGLIDRHFDERFVWEMAVHPRILDAVEAAVGPDILLLATHFFCKYPEAADLPGPPAAWAEADSTTPPAAAGVQAEKFVAWHQDVTYWGLEPPFAVTAWYAVDDADCVNGCMRVVPGSHTGLREHGKSDRAGNLLSINQAVSLAPEEEAAAIDLPLRAGEISLHHGLLIHGSNPNHSERRRCGMTIRYIPPYVRWTHANSLRRPWRAILVRGEDNCGYYPPTDPPF